MGTGRGFPDECTSFPNSEPCPLHGLLRLLQDLELGHINEEEGDFFLNLELFIRHAFY